MAKKIPVPEKADEAYLEVLPEFLSNQANEGRVRYRWRFDTPERFQDYMTNYYRLITEVDEAVGRIPTSHALVRRDWKYIEWPEFEHRQLFDLENDPTEKHNLAGNPEHAATEEKLRQRHDELRKQMR